MDEKIACKKNFTLKFFSGFILLLFCCVSLKAGNIVLNGSFETGTHWWGIYSLRYYSTADNFEKASCTKDTAVHGNKSLEIIVDGLSAQVLVSAPFYMKPGHEYTLSFYIKSDIPKKSVQYVIHSTGKTTGPSGRILDETVRCTDKWHRVCSVFTVPDVPDKRGFMDRYCIRIVLCHPGEKKGKIRLDAFQIEQGNRASEFAPYLPYSIGMKCTEPDRLQIFTQGERINITTEIYCDIPVKNFSLEYFLENYYTSKGKIVGSEHISLAKGQTITKSFTIPETLQRGSYKLWGILKKPDGKIARKAEFLFAVIKPNKKREFKPDSFFGLHLPSASRIDWRKYWNIPPRYELMFSGDVSPDSQFRLFADIGARWVRVFNTWRLAFIHPDEGQYNFKAAEPYLKLLDKYKILPLAIVVDQLNNRQWKNWGRSFQGIPTWMRSEKKSLGGSSKGKGDYLPDAEKFGEHIYNLVKHYGTKIPAWEIWNEPTVKMRWKSYMPILKSAYKNIKKACPDVIVAGLCGTGDFGGDPLGWIKNVLNINPVPLDVITVHTYASPAGEEESNAREMFRIIKEKSPDRNIPVWNTEVGTATVPAYSDIPPERIAYNRFTTYHPPAQADFLVGKEVMQKALGISKHFYFILGFGVSHFGPGSGMFNMLEYDGAPRPALPAYNTMTEIMEDTVFIKQITLAETDFCGVFKRKTDGNTIIFCWNFGKTPHIYSPDFSKINSLRILDIMGNPLLSVQKTGTKNYSLNFSNHPFYIIVSGKEASSAITALERIEIQRDFTVKFIRIMNNDKGEPCIAVKVRSQFNKPLELMIENTSLPQCWKIDSDSVTVKLLPREEKICFFKIVKYSPVRECSLNLTVTDTKTGKRKTFEKTIKTLFVKYIKNSAEANSKKLFTGNLNKPEQIKISTDTHPWKGKNDLSVELSGTWNKKFLNLYINVTDDIVNPENPPHLYNGDCVELFFDMDIAVNMNRISAEDYQLLFSPSGKGKKAVFRPVDKGLGLKYAESAKKVKYTCSEGKNGYKQKIAIPWDFLKDADGIPFSPAKGKIIGFDIAVDDRDEDTGTSRKTQIIWAGNADAYRNTNNYGIIILY